MATGKTTAGTGFALITGGTSGIGYELAKCFAEHEFSLILVARLEEGLQKAASDIKSQYNVEVHTITKDLMTLGAAKEVYDTVKSMGITVDVLVNDAGQGVWGKFVETELEREIDMVQLNVISLMSLTKYFLKDMVQRGNGKILQLASQVSKAPTPYMAVYAATKAFVYSFTQALVQELKDTGVTITALMPGATDTDFFHKAQAEDSVEYREKSLYDPHEVAQAGYKGLMEGSERVMPGARNKMQAVMGDLMPDSAVAANMKQHMKESKKQEGRTGITDPVSKQERERIQRQTGRPDGDIDPGR